MELEVSLVLDVLNKVVEFSLAQLFVHWEFLVVFVNMRLEILFDDLSELCD